MGITKKELRQIIKNGRGFEDLMCGLGGCKGAHNPPAISDFWIGVYNPKGGNVYAVYAVWDMLEHPVDAPILTESEPSSDDAQPINLVTAITPDLLPASDTTKEEAAKEHNPLASDEINTALAENPMIPATDQNAEVAIIQASTASHTPEPSVAVDPLAKLKAKQPHLRGKWEKVIQFRRLLTP